MKLPSSNEGIVPVGEQTHLRDYIRIIRKRQWSILSIFVSTVFATALYVLMQQPVYESTVSLLIEPTGPNVMAKSVTYSRATESRSAARLIASRKLTLGVAATSSVET